MDADGVRRAGGDTGTAAVAVIAGQFGLGHAADCRSEADRARLADIAAAAAFDVLACQTAFADLRDPVPGSLAFIGCDRAFRAAARAVAAEVTFARTEVDLCQLSPPQPNDLLRAGRNTVATAGASRLKFTFHQRPRRPNRRLVAAQITAEKLASCDDVVHRL